jgi:hypothetical protein
MRNVRLVWFVAVAVASAALSLSGAVGASTATTGNGAPSGAHYDLNIIGVPKGKTASMTGSNTHVIFVSLGTTSTKPRSTDR